MSDPITNRARSNANLKPFKKGQSGNPNGRPKKIITLATLAEDNSEKAIRRLIKLVDSEDDRVALQAAQALLDRAMGKPKQSMEISKPQRTLGEVTTSELMNAIYADGDREGTPEAEEGNGKPH